VAQTGEFVREVGVLWSEGVRLICINVLIIVKTILRLYIKL